MPRINLRRVQHTDELIDIVEVHASVSLQVPYQFGRHAVGEFAPGSSALSPRAVASTLQLSSLAYPVPA